jgi:alkyl sulfatase BDS1-like metallo-beta-lactamase superfamily hydrolase
LLVVRELLLDDATPHDGVVQLRLDDDHFRLTIRNGRLLAKRAEVDDADTTITTTTTTLQSLVFAERTVADAERSGDLTITGDRDTAEHLLHSS